jgi:hypothetical protein
MRRCDVSEFKSLAAALEGHYEKKLAELSDDLRLLVVLSFDFHDPTQGQPSTPIHTPIPGLGRRQVLISPHWDYLTPLQRESLAMQYDAQFNPIFSRQRAEEYFRQGFDEESKTVPARIVAQEPGDRVQLPSSNISTHPQPTRSQTGRPPIYDPLTVYLATVPQQRESLATDLDLAKQEERLDELHRELAQEKDALDGLSRLESRGEPLNAVSVEAEASAWLPGELIRRIQNGEPRQNHVMWVVLRERFPALQERRARAVYTSMPESLKGKGGRKKGSRNKKGSLNSIQN